MSMIAYTWIILLGVRETLNIFIVHTTLLTFIITGLQFFHLFLLLQQDKWHFTRYHLMLPFFLLFTVFNSDTLPTVNILLSFILLKREKIQKITFVIMIAFLINLFVWASAYSIGFLRDEVVNYDKGSTHSLGFRNSNTPMMLFMMFTLCTSTFLRQKIKLIFPILFLIIPCFVVFKYTLGRTCFFTVLLYFFLVYYFSFNRKYAFEKQVSIILPIILFSITFVFLHIWYKIPAVNVFFTGRFRINGNHLKNLSILNYFIGYKVPEGAMDSAYLSLLFNGGILNCLFFLTTCFLGIKNISNNNLRIFLPFVLAYLISGFTEGTFSLFRLPTVLLYKIFSDNIDFNFLKTRFLKPAYIN